MHLYVARTTPHAIEASSLERRVSDPGLGMKEFGSRGSATVYEP